MKKLSQSTKPAKVKERVADLQLVEARYRLLKKKATKKLNRKAVVCIGISNKSAGNNHA